VFPRVEILLVTTTLFGVSEAFGALVSTMHSVPAFVSVLAILYIVFFVIFIALLTLMCSPRTLRSFL
jgi:hypothetical protein